MKEIFLLKDGYSTFQIFVCDQIQLLNFWISEEDNDEDDNEITIDASINLDYNATVKLRDTLNNWIENQIGKLKN